MEVQTEQQKADNLIAYFSENKGKRKEEIECEAIELARSVKDDLYKIYMDNIGEKFNEWFENRVAYWENVISNIENR